MYVVLAFLISPMIKTIFLEDVDIDHSPMVRADLRPEVIEEYASIYKKDKKKMPHIDVFYEAGNKRMLIGDGMHRLQAMRSLNFKACQANVHAGVYEDALKFALTANERHGIRRSQADKRKAVEEAIRQWPKVSNVQIANLASVDDHTVKAVRDWLEEQGKIAPEPVREGRDGSKRAASAKPTSESRGSTAPDMPRKLEAKCKTGAVLTVQALKYWNRTPEIKELLDELTTFERKLKKAQSMEDLMFCEVNISAALADIDKIYTNLQTGLPYAVCTQCQGQPKTQPKGECRLCCGRAVISKFRWDKVPAEIRKMREMKK